MKITRQQERSGLTASLQTLIRPFANLISKPGKPLPAGSPQLDIPSSAAKLCTIQERRVEDIWLYDISAEHASPTSEEAQADRTSVKKRRIYYIAGGSFCMPPSSDHWEFLVELGQKAPGLHITLLSPPLAPHSPAPLAYPQLLQLYKTLMTQSNESNESVCFAGDSSGANLALSLVLNALREFPAVKSPENVLLISPVVDLTFTNPAVKDVEKRDPVLRLPIEVETGKAWAASWSLDDPRLSPLYADVSDLRTRATRIHGVLGTNDLLTPDAIRFRNRCEEAEIDGEWLEWEKQMHCFPLAWHYHLPESIEGKDWIVNLLKRDLRSYSVDPI